MITTPIKATYQDYLKLGEDQRYELIEGELLMTPSPLRKHQKVVLRLCETLSLYAKASGSGEVYVAPLDVILSDHDVVQPDVIFVSNERKHILGDWIHGAPDLVAEVVSTGSIERDRFIKRALYEKYGVREYWIVDLERECIEVLSNHAGRFELLGIFFKEDVLSTSLLTDLNLAVGSIFND